MNSAQNGDVDTEEERGAKVDDPAQNGDFDTSAQKRDEVIIDDSAQNGDVVTEVISDILDGDEERGAKVDDSAQNGDVDTEVMSEILVSWSNNGEEKIIFDDSTKIANNCV